MRSCIVVAAHVFSEKTIEDDVYKIVIPSYVNGYHSPWFRDCDDNIENKAHNYSELTSLYWFWKNRMEDYDYVGLSHYRRYFTKNGFCQNAKYILNQNDTHRILKKYDVILKRQESWKGTVENHFIEYDVVSKADMELVRTILLERYPNYISTYDERIRYGHKASYLNMFVMNKNNAKKYCDFLFDILGELERRVDFTEYNNSQKRLCGYIGEILLDVFCHHNFKRIKYMSVYYTKDTGMSRKGQIYQNFFRWIRNSY